MAIIEWDRSWSVNVPDLDEQHKKLIGMVNQLHDAMSKGQARDVLQSLLDKLVQYTVHHFSAEENYLRTIQYADLNSHKTSHEKLRNQVQDYQRRFHGGETRLGVEILNFLSDWLKNHIQGTDKKYAPACAAAGKH